MADIPISTTSKIPLSMTQLLTPILSEPEMIDFYLHASEFLRSENWEDCYQYFRARANQFPTIYQALEKVKPALVHQPPLKRRRGSPNQSNPLPPLPKCKNIRCNSPDTIEDVTEGCVVCVACGMIQSTSVMETAVTNAQFHEGVSRFAVHRYSRWIYLHSM